MAASFRRAYSSLPDTARGGHGSDPVLRSAESSGQSQPLRFAPGTSAADAAEKQGNALEAAREYQRAAELEPSEANLFDWGTELLTHRAADQAVEVFANGHRLFPRSTRMLLGLAVALYSRGSYDQAAQRFFEAADLNPSDPAPYLFLGKVSSGAITDSDGFDERLERFARLQPENAWANYYYAASLWKHRRRRRSDLPRCSRCSKKPFVWIPISAPPFCSSALSSPNRAISPKPSAAYQSAIEASPPMEEAHYRLAHGLSEDGRTSEGAKRN